MPLRATLNGASERPAPVNSAATGTFAGSPDTVSRVLSYTVTYSGLTPVMGHLHRITPNATNFTGGVEIPFTSLTSPISGTATLASKSRVDSMLNGFYYANLHTTAFPTGEIRGDITPVINRPVRSAAVMNGASEKPTPVNSAATGLFTGLLDRASRVLSYTVTYSGLTPVMGHLHRINAANGTGPVEIPFASLTSPIAGTATLRSQGSGRQPGQRLLLLKPAHDGKPRGRNSGKITPLCDGIAVVHFRFVRRVFALLAEALFCSNIAGKQPITTYGTRVRKG